MAEEIDGSTLLAKRMIREDMNKMAWWPIGILTANHKEYHLKEDELVLIVNVESAYNFITVQRLVEASKSNVQDQLLCHNEIQFSINNPTSPEVFITTSRNEILKVPREIVAILDPDEFTARMLSLFGDVDKNVNYLSDYMKFFTRSTEPYIDGIFTVIHQCVVEILERLRTYSFQQNQRDRNSLASLWTCFHPAIVFRIQHSNFFKIDPEDVTVEKVIAALDPQIAFSENALASIQQMLEALLNEQQTNKLLYFDSLLLGELLNSFRNHRSVYNILQTILFENGKRLAAARQAPDLLSQYYDNRTNSTTDPYYICGTAYPKNVIISLVENIVTAPPDRFPVYAKALFRFLYLEPSLLLAFDDQDFKEEIVGMFEKALREHGMTETFDETMLGSAELAADVQRYYVYRKGRVRSFYYRDKMLCSLTYRPFGMLTNSQEIIKHVVLAPPTAYDKEAYGEIDPNIRITVKFGELESDTPEITAHHYRPELKRDLLFPSAFLRTWTQNDQLLREYIFAQMEHEEMHLVKFISEVVHHDESTAKVLIQCLLRAEKRSANIWHSGAIWHVLIACLDKCNGVRAVFIENMDILRDKFIISLLNTTVSQGSLLVYYSHLKAYFTEEHCNKIEIALEKRKKVEGYFTNFVNHGTDYRIDDEFRLFAGDHGYVFIICFINRFLRLIMKNDDIHLLEQDLILFRDTCYKVPRLRKIMVDVNFKTPIGRIFLTTSKIVPKQLINNVFNLTWPALHATDMIGKTVLEQFEKSSITLIKELGKGKQAVVWLAKVPNYPQEVVAKMTTDVDAFYVLGGEIDSLMRLLSHPHVLHIYGYIVANNDHDGILMEYCRGGNVADVIYDKTECLDEKRILSLLIQAASGLLFLHQHGLIHRDIKPDNMLLDATRKELKISDLGLTKIIPEKSRTIDAILTEKLAHGPQSEIMATTLGSSAPSGNSGKAMTAFCCTDGYRAPEVTEGPYTSAIDVYSFGCSLWEIIYRIEPKDDLIAATWGVTSSFEGDVPIPSFTPSDDLRALGARMVHPNPNSRPVMEDVYKELQRLQENEEKKPKSRVYDMFYS